MSIGLLLEFIAFQENSLTRREIMLLTVTAKNAHRAPAGLFGSCSVGGGGYSTKTVDITSAPPLSMQRHLLLIRHWNCHTSQRRRA